MAAARKAARMGSDRTEHGRSLRKRCERSEPALRVERKPGAGMPDCRKGGSEVPHLKIGIQLTSLRQPLRRALQTAARLGARGVEIDARSQLRPSELTQTGIRQFRKLLEDMNLRVCAVGFLTRRGYNVREDLERRVEATRQAMKLAFDLGASVVVNSVGRVPAESSGPDWDLLVQVLSDLGRYGQRVGVTLAAETGAEPPPDLARLIDCLPEGSLGVNLDPGNLIVNGFSAREAVGCLGTHVLHVHARDGVRDLAKGRGVEVPLGRGSVDFAELAGKLEECQYQGYFTVERQNAEDPVREVGDAVAYLSHL